MHNDVPKQAIEGRKLKQLEGRFVSALPFELGEGVLPKIMTIGYTLSGSLFYVSEKYAAYFGRSPEELFGKNMAWCLSSRDIGTVLRAISTLSVQSPSRMIFHGVVRQDGSEVRQCWLHMAKMGDEGEVVGYQAAGLELDPVQAGAFQAESLLRQHLQRHGPGVVGAGNSSLRCFVS
ncbi:hypothetical protein DPQ33_13235 [Oceanidesulfovibrio indonesiensis]|uniref:PAS domain-containing protein n=1 Tax=Oceanidesulfovibrio indonesiensis TaxID=54767 RepID=A0A7M3MCS6_9BACT|nr:PAS domain S-box protein [Oceanidesulfovibrio indonesiensis]TVM16277.1 hypothetical protein DPQ33_13235 [Oceanidesulfovibrio indonesiensis]